MPLFLVSFFAKFAGLSGFLKRIPPKVWLIIAIALALVAGFVWHQHAAHKALRTADATGYARAMNEIETKAKALKAKADTLNAAIAADERKKNDEQARNIERSADALGLRGPGKARCAGNSSPSGAAGGYVAPGGASDDPLAGLPDPAGINLIGVPFPDAVAAAKQADLNRAEVISWRDWYDRIAKSWPK